MNQAKPTLVRYSLRSLLVFIALASIFLASVLSAREGVAFVVYLVAIFVLPVAIVLAIHCRDSHRVFWAGFFAFGIWSYTVMHDQTSFPNHQIREYLARLLEEPTGRLNQARLDENTRAHVMISFRKPKLPIDQMKSSFPREWNSKLKDELGKLAETASRIAWWDMQIAMAIAGGVIACAVYERSRRR